MLKRKHMILGFLAYCLAVTLFIGVATSGNQIQQGTQPYDPWCDVNCDGVINIVDFVNLGLRFDTTGTPLSHAAVQFEGNISVPAAAFTPVYTDKNWQNWGIYLRNAKVAGYAYFVAGVQLPHRATITNLTFYWYDLSADDYVTCVPNRYNGTFGPEMLAWINNLPVSVAPGYGSTHAVSIDFAVVDNNKYTYYLQVAVPPGPFEIRYVVIEYEY